MDLEDLRLSVYRSYAETGRAPTVEVLATANGAAVDEVRVGLAALAQARHVVLGDDGAIVMAHPFSSVNLGFSVMGRDTLWWGGCAWDAFALPHLLTSEDDVLVATRCPACDRALAWVVDREAPPSGDEVAHFLVPAARIWDDVVHTCGHQRLFCSSDCIRDWLRRNGHEHGYELDLATLWRLAGRWYAGRLDRGYQRRDPATATAYLYDVGLRGPFWGLPDD